MATPENAICLLFFHEIRRQAEEIGNSLSKSGVRCLTERQVLNAFVNEWTIARIAWIQHLSRSIIDEAFHFPIQSMIREAVNTYDLIEKPQFVEYEMLIFSEKDEDDGYPVPGSLFLSGFSQRLQRIPGKSLLSPRKKLTPDEQAEIMIVVIQSCWAPGFNLISTLEALRPKITPEIISVS